jgi:CBS domain-containing protein
MQVRDVMTLNPTCCSAEDSLQHVAQLMVENDCGEIPVVDGVESRMPVGVVTDRDIVCRTVAKGMNPLDMTVGEVMTSPTVSVSPGDSVDDCCEIMERNQIRRVPVVEAGGPIIGIVALADLTDYVTGSESGAVLHAVSQTSESASGA